MENYLGSYDVAVIGAGHAGIEASLVSARLGVKTAIFTMSLDAIGMMPCNPSIGGTAKGHLVREIDALGGEMGKAADATFLQSRMLNRGKGPAVHSLRVQTDRQKYHIEMKKRLENQQGLDIIQAEIVDIELDENNNVCGVVTALGVKYKVKTAIICSGTFLKGKIFVGSACLESGPDGMHAANGLSQSLKKIGVNLRRFKTGTPARVHKKSIDFSKLQKQEGETPITPFSFETDPTTLVNKEPCHIAYTNENTHQIIRDNLHRSPLYGGAIEGVGPRYCPSIEDKVVRFKGKNRHQVFVEPLGEDTQEMYIQGLSTSLPIDVQMKIYKSVEGFENIKIMRNAYAIEYDSIDPLDLKPTLEVIKIGGLFGAGQFNGTSGYEEAAAQGLIAGINAAQIILGKEPFILDRASSYIGTLIDDLVTKGCSDPYRMMTSRSEYRLILRQDNADKRLTPFGRKLGLINDERWNNFLQKEKDVEDEIKRLSHLNFGPSDELNKMLTDKGTVQITTGTSAIALIRRPEISYDDLAPFDEKRKPLDIAIRQQVEIEIKYDGYIKKQIAQVKQMRRLESKLIPQDIVYKDIRGLRLEAIEKLERVNPVSVGQASRISGVSPADISVLLIYMEQNTLNS